MWFVKWVLSIALKIGFVILIFCAGAFAFLDGFLRELDEHNANYPRTSIEQTQKNLPIYFEKINEILKAHDMPIGDFRVINENHIGGVIEFDDSEIDIGVSNYSDREKINVSFRKYYKNVKQLKDLVPPTTDEYSVICEIMQSISKKEDYVPSMYSVTFFVRSIFSKDELSEKQADFERGEYFQIEHNEDFADGYGSLWILLDPRSESGTVSLSIWYSMTLDNNEE